MRVVFMGSPEFAVPSLDALAARHEVALVVTQPDRPSGRGRHAAPPPVKVRALELGLAVAQPERLRDPATAAALRAPGADAFVVVAYGRILPPELLAMPRLGCVNLHASLLPRWRGAAPIAHAIAAGDRETGVSIMRMDEGLDTGPVLLARREPIREDDTAGTLGGRLARLGAEALREALEAWEARRIVPVAQDGVAATHAPRLRKQDGRIDFSAPAARVRDRIRAMDPWPGAFALLDGGALRLFRPRATEGRGAPGEVLGTGCDGVRVACGEGAVAIGELQSPARRRLAAADFLRGRPLPPGTRLR